MIHRSKGPFLTLTHADSKYNSAAGCLWLYILRIFFSQNITILDLPNLSKYWKIKIKTNILYVKIEFLRQVVARPSAVCLLPVTNAKLFLMQIWAKLSNAHPFIAVSSLFSVAWTAVMAQTYPKDTQLI